MLRPANIVQKMPSVPCDRCRRQEQYRTAPERIQGRKCGTVIGYSYSEANRNCAFTWNQVTFLDYIKDPKANIPGTKKLFAGIKDVTEASNL